MLIFSLIPGNIADWLIKFNNKMDSKIEKTQPINVMIVFSNKNCTITVFIDAP